MPKPLKENFLARVYRLFHGMIFYNTIYWRRASDGLQPPRLTRDERALNRPVRDIAKIKPRANPRAKLDAVENGTPDVSVPLIKAAIGLQEPGFEPVHLPMQQITALTEAASRNIVPAEGDHSLSRKKKRRRIRQSMPKGFLSRWFSGLP